MISSPAANVDIRELTAADLEAAAQVLARGMLNNPNHVAAFGGDPQRRLTRTQAFFAAVLPHLAARGVILGAFDGATLIGVCGMTPPHRCQLRSTEKLQILRGMLANAPLPVALRVLRWANAWGRQEPRQAHWHLGPVAVDAHLQGRGVGSVLMAAFSGRVDEAGGVSYLETDKRENLHFYERHGFEVCAEAPVLGLPNWFMLRRRDSIRARHRAAVAT